MRRKALCMAAVSLCLVTGSARAAEYFNESDDYKDGEEIVNVFLKEDDYRLMVEDIERNGETFDWGWVKVAGAEPPSAEEPKKGGVMGKLRRGGGGRGNPAEPRNLGFSFSSYKTVSIPKVENFSGMIPPETPVKVRDSFVQAMQTLGLEVVDGAADLDLKVAIVDLKRDSTFIYVGRVDPFIELELRLKDVKTGENLILLRNQAHSTTPEDAAFNYASTLLKFLR